MKLRDGFVSNSSSSSFIIKDKSKFDEVISLLPYNNDYYIYNDVLYTTFVSDGYDEYIALCRLADEQVYGGHGYPYDETQFIGVIGAKGETVYIGKDRLTEEEQLELTKDFHVRAKNELYNHVLTAEVDTDNLKSLQDFYQECIDIIEGD